MEWAIFSESVSQIGQLPQHLILYLISNWANNISGAEHAEWAKSIEKNYLGDSSSGKEKEILKATLEGEKFVGNLYDKLL